jgi:hypothetical protein
MRPKPVTATGLCYTRQALLWRAALFPRWLPLYLLGIVALTLYPFLAPACEPRGWVMRMSPVDFAANLLAFLPLGLALHRASLLRALTLCFALSLTIELCQGYLPRFQDLSDLVSNTLGAFVGHRIGVAWTARWPGPLFRPVTRRIVLRAAAAILLTAALTATFIAPANDFSNWARFPLVIGNSVRGDHPWTGEIFEVALFDRSLEADEATPSTQDSSIPALWTAGGPILWLRFSGEEISGRIDGPAGPVRYRPRVGPSTGITQAGLQLLPSGVGLERWVSDHVVDRLTRTGELTLDLRLRAAAEHQYGPAQILSLANGRGQQNLTLAQRGSALSVRLRTPASAGNAAKPEAETRWGVVTREPQHIRLSYDGARIAIRVDARCQSTSHLALANAPLIKGHFLGLTLVLCTALSALALASFSRNPRLRLFLAGLGGGGAWSLLYAVGLWDYLETFGLAALLVGLLSLLGSLPLLRQPR